MSEMNNAPKQETRLDDEQRVKVLSPGMLVFKRFIRNRLAIVGLAILVAMFLFSFVGGLISPYEQDQVFRKYEQTLKDYASAAQNTELRYVTVDGGKFPSTAAAQFILAINKGQTSFESGGVNYAVTEEGDNFYTISVNETIASFMAIGGKPAFAKGVDAPSEAMQAAITEAMAAGETAFELDGVSYQLEKQGKNYVVSRGGACAMASMLIFDAFDTKYSALISSYDFRYACEKAMTDGANTFEVGGTTYTLTDEGDGAIISLDGENVAAASDMIVNAISPDVFLTVGFKAAFAEAAAEHGNTFTFTYAEEDGEEVFYSVNRVAGTYTIQNYQTTQLNNMYESPSREHPLGTDGNGMDVLTRLMYGGRISLLVGFVVVIIELLIGIMVGGVSGYFGGWVDTFLMRFVDLFNSIPYYPMMIIAGAVMDTMEINPYVRIFLLMLIMGLMGWTGVARVVRGQILSLREQDFMVATEATGIRVSRRIFRHLVPNVMPLLIVQATMGLGGIIIAEATLSFLGLGVKYPIASWGNIINAATNIHVMTNYWFIWVPAGLLIFLTVLGFNFVGDGLRDAFDPKMKR